jgi:hypothetical protein
MKIRTQDIAKKKMNSLARLTRDKKKILSEFKSLAFF